MNYKKRLYFVASLLLLVYPKIAQNVTVKCYPHKIDAFQGEKIVLNLEVINKLPYSLRASDNYFFSYHIYDKDGKLMSFENKRFVLPKVLRRKRLTTFKLPVYFKFKKEGVYKIAIDMVKEGEFWG